MKKHRPGRPTKMTKEVQKKILDAIELGLSRERSAAYAGVSVAVLYSFQAKFPEFQERIKRAEARCQAFDLAQIKKASREGQWTASAWRLERKWPEEWGKVDRHMIRMQRDVAPLPQQYIDAINTALGVKGEFQPIGPPLPEDGEGEIDPEILPQD